MIGDCCETPCFAELELMQSAYGSDFQLCSTTNSGDCDGVIFSIALHVYDSTIKISIPLKYPDEPIKFTIDGKFTNSDGKKLKLDLNQYIVENATIGSLDLCQRASELLQDLISSKEQHISEPSIVYLRKEVSIARFLIYFHHIVSSAKRAFLQDCARYLSLGGFSKPGYPGLVIVEGDKLDVIEFVNRVQRLRWKHMVVRGEDIEELMISQERRDINSYLTEEEARLLVDSARRLPSVFLGEINDVSEASAICSSCCLHDLFLTSMKIYNSGESSER